MELKFYEVSQRCVRVGLQLGFCEGWSICDGNYVLVRPFKRFVLQSPKGSIECRGDWTYGEVLPQRKFAVAPIARQLWMELEMVDVLTAMALCTECAIDLPPNGHSRLTIL